MDYHPSPTYGEKKLYAWVCRIHDYERGMPELGIEIDMNLTYIFLYKMH
jgi:hypothetical protein